MQVSLVKIKIETRCPLVTSKIDFVPCEEVFPHFIRLFECIIEVLFVKLWGDTRKFTIRVNTLGIQVIVIYFA